MRGLIVKLDEDIPMEDAEPEAEDVAPPRRVSSPRTALRGARIRRRAYGLGAALSAVALAGVAGAAAWLLAGYFRTDARYRLATLELRGATHLSRGAVEEVFLADQGRSIYLVPIEARRGQLERLAWVRAATVSRVLPGEIWVRVEERQPVAFLWTRNGVSLIDADGVLLDAPPETYFSLPVLRGVTAAEPPARRREKLQRFVRFMDAIQGAGGNAGGKPEEQISEVNLADPRDLRAVAAAGGQSVLLHFGAEAFRERFETYLAHIGEWRQQFADIQSIDLRYEGQAVIHAGEPQTVPLSGTAGQPPAPARATAAAPSVAVTEVTHRVTPSVTSRITALVTSRVPSGVTP